jgi:hypothetical protein
MDTRPNQRRNRKEPRPAKQETKAIRTQNPETILDNLTNDETEPERKDRKNEMIEIIKNTSTLTTECWLGEISEARNPFGRAFSKDI